MTTVETAWARVAEHWRAGRDAVWWCQRTARGVEYAWGVGEMNVGKWGEPGTWWVTDASGATMTLVRPEKWGRNELPPVLEPGAVRVAQPAMQLKPVWTDHVAVSRATWKAWVEALKTAGRRGEVWVGNLTTELRGDREQTTDPTRDVWGLYGRHLRRGVPLAGGCWRVGGRTWVSLSPETFVEWRAGELHTYPIKGTGTRAYLTQSEKERSELDMVTDLLRNDLGRICDRVEVRAERTLTEQGGYAHGQSHIVGVKPEKLTMEEFQKLLPVGSVTGAPKRRVCEILAGLEGRERGDYTGTCGVWLGEREMVSGVMIRVVEVTDEGWRYGVGGGITVESDPEREWQELGIKAGVLWS